MAVRALATAGGVALAVVGCIGAPSSMRDAPPLPVPYEIDATGFEYAWRFTYPGADGRLGTADDVAATTDLHVPVDTPIRLQLHSQDYVYFFGIPDLDLRQIAVPDLDFSLEWTSAAEGRFELLGDEMCGRPHETLDGTLVVTSRAAFRAWLDDQDLAAAGPATDR